jgi:hypothetical protein
MASARPVPALYQKLGVKPIIHGAGTTTRYGGMDTISLFTWSCRTAIISGRWGHNACITSSLTLVTERTDS